MGETIAGGALAWLKRARKRRVDSINNRRADTPGDRLGDSLLPHLPGAVSRERWRGRATAHPLHMTYGQKLATIVPRPGFPGPGA